MERAEYLSYLVKTVLPVLEAAGKEELIATFPIEEREGTNRAGCSYFEWIGRLVCGIAPWLEAEISDPEEERLRKTCTDLTLRAIQAQFDPASPDYAGFDEKIPAQPQFLVDLAFLAQGILRAPKVLKDAIDAETRSRILDVLVCSRKIQPYPCNWILFSAVVEALIQAWTGNYAEEPVRYGLTQMDAWYKGDGIYGDGPELAVDYYNSYVIHPMLQTLADHFPELCGPELVSRIRARSLRYARIQYMMIAADGTFPATGRSITYRCGAFHHLADCALRHQCSEEITPGDVREALGRVIQRTLTPEDFRPDGALWIGLSGHQPGLGEDYISTGSLYLCVTAFLPLGLAPADPFWMEAPSSADPWSGRDCLRDHAYHESIE